MSSLVCNYCTISSGVITAGTAHFSLNLAIDLPQSGIKRPIITCHKDFHLLSQCSTRLHQNLPLVITVTRAGQFTLELGIRQGDFASDEYAVSSTSNTTIKRKAMESHLFLITLNDMKCLSNVKWLIIFTFITCSL